MDNLIAQMTDESFEQIGHLVVAKLMEKNSDELRVIIHKILDALYAPIMPKDDRLEHLITFVRDEYADLDDEAKKSLTLQIQKTCMQVRTNSGGANNNMEGANYLANQINTESVPYAYTPKWMDKDKTIGKKVRIQVGTHYGMIGRVDGFERNMVLVKSADGKITKYLQKHVEFLE